MRKPLKKIQRGVFKFLVSDHAEKRYIERFLGGKADERPIRKIKEEASLAVELFRIKDSIYYRYKDRVMVCVEKGKNTYKIKTVLNWYMMKRKIFLIEKLQNRERYQNIIRMNKIK